MDQSAIFFHPHLLLDNDDSLPSLHALIMNWTVLIAMAVIAAISAGFYSPMQPDDLTLLKCYYISPLNYGTSSLMLSSELPSQSHTPTLLPLLSPITFAYHSNAAHTSFLQMDCIFSWQLFLARQCISAIPRSTSVWMHHVCFQRISGYCISQYVLVSVTASLGDWSWLK